jgi:hypothetical protein
VSWVLDNGLANAGQIWGWNVSDIHPITDTTRALVWGDNVILVFLALAAITQSVQILAESRRQAKNTSSAT